LKVSSLNLKGLGGGRAVEAASVIPGKALASISRVDSGTSVLKEVTDTVGLIIGNRLALRLGSAASSDTVLAIKGALVNAVVASSSRVLAPALTTADSTAGGVGEATANVVELVASGSLLDTDSLEVGLVKVAFSLDIIPGDRFAVRLGGATSLDATIEGQLVAADAVIAQSRAGAVSNKTTLGSRGDGGHLALLKAAAGQLVVGGSGDGGD
jgi:hypothetical protein